MSDQVFSIIEVLLFNNESKPKMILSNPLFGHQVAMLIAKEVAIACHRGVQVLLARFYVW